MNFSTVNPRNSEIIKEYSYQDYSSVKENIEDAKSAYNSWRKTKLSDRKKLMYLLGDKLTNNADEYGALISLEMGKHISEAVGEVKKCALLAKGTADEIDEWLSNDDVYSDGIKHQIRFESVGIIFSIMPWNFPFWQVLRAAIPTILAGNVCILKHAESTTECGLLIQRIFDDVGFPKGVFQTVVTTHVVAEKIIANSAIRGVSFTGSCRGGSEVAAVSGKYLKKCILELGGSDPFIVLPDADIESAVQGAIIGRFMNAGQVCISSKRFIIHRDVAEEFITRFKEEIEKIDIAPLVNASAVDAIDKQVQDARSKGAKIIYGGMRKEGKGNFYEPTLIINVSKDMTVMSEEVFGPVAPLQIVNSEEEAIEVANDTQFGLGGSVWGMDRENAMKVAEKIECGAIFINSIVKSDPLMPFGGVKNSGFGVELAKYGLYEMLNIKGYNVY
ncbi:MAG: NAD-dependent succinate-semialdehyde dehydrogenase [Bacteriovoracaceae bacterium]|nr:NAD-dependent succinate-semialdehyde dehydrogenase [Bacteriovoracaceae bacterium]